MQQHPRQSTLWYPCTQMKSYEQTPPLRIAAAHGVYLEDYEGKRYIDAISSWWVNLFGHTNKVIGAALKNQLDQLEHVLLASVSHAPAEQLADRLVSITDQSLQHVFFTDNGSSGIEAALKMSHHAWQHLGYPKKNRFISLSNAYHGETLGALSLSNLSLYKSAYADLFKTQVTAPSPDCFLCEPGEGWRQNSLKALDAMEALLLEYRDQVSAVIVEPLVQCAGLMRMYHPVYLTGLRELCDQYQAHLIADEIAVGFGRTGTLFAHEQSNIAPDILCLSKGLTGGYLPLCALVATDELYAAFYADPSEQKAFLHSHSYSGNPLATRAALATLDIFQDNDVMMQNQLLAEQMKQQAMRFQSHPNVAEVRQTGMILAIELVKQKTPMLSFPREERRGLQVCRQAMQLGVFLRPLGDVIYCMPPYVINAQEIQQVMDAIEFGLEVLR